MPTQEQKNELAQHLAALTRPQLSNRHSSSVPSTPFQHKRRLSFGARSPSPTKHLPNGSPRSSHSQVDPGAPRTRAKAPSFAGCRFETGMAFSRRRIPYAVGGDQLERAKAMPKKFLNAREEARLTGDMRELYDRLLPTPESDHRRAAFVQKLDHILNQRWAGADIKVHVFGSSGNLLCTSDADVDICITTSMKTLEKTCLLAETLAAHGMQRVICVPHAKVPIVKFWDPEIQLACDMNVNNTLALENTRMIKTYVQIDDRVRPLAMIVKQWTKQRILNDAALGGTLSSYAWICMILHFLQTRNPPILPSLHEKASKSSPLIGGKYAAFNDNIEQLRGFGKENHETLGDLLFQFFRRYAHDIDYDKNVISVREGRLISKEAKKWHLMQNNRLCVEEPFTIERNLGNTADDISFRGIHLELRRAFDLIADAKLDECLEEYTFPPAEERIWEKPTPKPPPVISRSRSQSQSSRGKGGYGNRGGRHHSGGTSKSRRASSAAATNKFPLPSNGSLNYHERPVLSPDMSIQAQFDQLRLSQELFAEMQNLQRQEYELRFKHRQNQLQAELEFQHNAQAAPPASHSSRDTSWRYPNVPPIPMSAPLRSSQYHPAHIYPQVPGTPPQNVHTQPSSPSLKTAQPDLRRSIHRSSAADGNSSSNVRSHSQPARTMPPNVNVPSVPALPVSSQQLLQYQTIRQYQAQQEQIHNQTLDAHGGYRMADPSYYPDLNRPPLQPSFDEGLPKEYAGYWIHDSTPLATYKEDYRVARLPMIHDLYPRVRGVPPPISRIRDRDGSRSPSPAPVLPLRDRAFSLQSASSGHAPKQRFDRVPGTAPLMKAAGPLIVNGTDTLQTPEAPPMVESISRATTVSETTSGSTSDEHSYQTPNTADLEPYFRGPFEEGFAFDQAQHLYHSHQMADRLRHANVDSRKHIDPAARRLANQQHEGGLNLAQKPTDRKQSNGRGLNIQFGELDYARPPVKSEQRTNQEGTRPLENGPLPDPTQPVSSNNQGDQVQASIPLLSPVREVRTPSPAGKRKGDTENLAKQSSIKRASAKMDLHIPSWAELLRARKAKEQTPSDGKDSKTNHSMQTKANGIGSLPRPPHASSPTPVPVPLPNLTDAAKPKLTGASHVANEWQVPSKKHRKQKSRTESGHSSELVVHDSEKKGG